MKSMTGYGTAKIDNHDLHLDIAIRAVNGRFLEIRFHGPREYSEFEAEVKKVINKTIERGTVDVFISRKLSPKAKIAKIVVAEDLAKEWLKSYRALGKKLKLTSKANMETVMRAPDIFRVEESSHLVKDEHGVLFSTLKKAVALCDEERKREGHCLQKELIKLLSLLTQRVEAVSAQRAMANALLEEKYLSRLKKLGLDGQIEPQRMAQEIVIQVDRADVSEEITRLNEHLKLFTQLVSEGNSQGKKLDFYTQELLREVNTIGSKSNLAELTQNVVEAKTIIERIREQVQNIE